MVETKDPTTTDKDEVRHSRSLAVLRERSEGVGVKTERGVRQARVRSGRTGRTDGGDHPKTISAADCDG
jgi:hypothetical protein